MTLDIFASRRSLLTYGGAVALALAAGIAAPQRARAQNTKIPVEKLMQKGALPDIWMGRENAPVTIVEYASLTCSHCASFHAGTFKELKKRYIDTGKVRMTVREFPFDPLALAGFMLARCEGPMKRDALIDLLFARQRDWAGSANPFDALVKLTRQAGMSKEAFEKCLKDKSLYENVTKVRDAGSKDFNVQSTPTFFINGVMLTGDRAIEEFAKVIDPMVGGKK